MITEYIFIQNKYYKWYLELITKATNRAKTREEATNMLGYVEGHHIVPKAFNTTNTSIAYLTAKEHFIAHRLLCYCTEGEDRRKMEYAITIFTERKMLNTRQLALALSYKSKPCSESRRNNISKARKLTKKIQCEHCTKYFDPGNFKQYHGDRCKLNPAIDSSILLARSSKAKKAYNTQLVRGTYHKPAQLMGNFKCPHCSKEGNNWGSMQRWHYDNCKSLSTS